MHRWVDLERISGYSSRHLRLKKLSAYTEIHWIDIFQLLSLISSSFYHKFYFISPNIEAYQNSCHNLLAFQPSTREFRLISNLRCIPKWCRWAYFFFSIFTVLSYFIEDTVVLFSTIEASLGHIRSFFLLLRSIKKTNIGRIQLEKNELWSDTNMACISWISATNVNWGCLLETFLAISIFYIISTT